MKKINENNYKKLFITCGIILLVLVIIVLALINRILNSPATDLSNDRMSDVMKPDNDIIATSSEVQNESGNDNSENINNDASKDDLNTDLNDSNYNWIDKDKIDGLSDNKETGDSSNVNSDNNGFDKTDNQNNYNNANDEKNGNNIDKTTDRSDDIADDGLQLEDMSEGENDGIQNGSDNHIHNWTYYEKKNYVESVTHIENVLVSAEWNEEIYEWYQTCECGWHAEHTGAEGTKEIGVHIGQCDLYGYVEIHGTLMHISPGYSSVPYLVDTIYHPAEYEEQLITDKQAYTVVYKYRKCVCGAEELIDTSYEY